MLIRGQGDVDEGLQVLLALDPRLEPIAAIAGPLPLRLGSPGFAGLAHIIVSQMISRQSAQAIWSRMLSAMETVDSDRFLALDVAAVSQLGLSRAKAACLRTLAETVMSGKLDLVAAANLPAEEAMALLTALPGIGPWTAEVYLMFSGGHADIFPAGDVALRAAVGDAFSLTTRPDIATVAEIALAWRPWRSVAARLFWAYYAAKSGRNALPAAQ
ncbi:DNA-3-methyladenine glycosylase II [Rhizobium sp. RU36D]|nr:DNA-3-methyladenine glycosylase II [Rhizobium sp. RU36D]